MVWNTPPREAHHERRNLGDVVYVPVFWLQDSGRRQFALIRLPFLSGELSEFSVTWAKASLWQLIALATISASQAVIATYALALVLFHVLIEPRKRAEKPN
jgi:hypothetical protein